MRPTCIPRRTPAATVAFAALALALSAPDGRADPWVPQEGPFGGAVVALDRIGSGAVYAMRNDAIFRTTDDGASWTDVASSAGFTFLALDVTESGAIWAGTSSRGVAWSLNGGLTWTNDQIETNTHTGLGASILTLAVDPLGRILAGPYRSVNQGASFVRMSVSPHCYAIEASGHALAGTNDGVFRSTDGGASWIPRNAGMAGQRVEALAVDGATILAGTGSGDVWRSGDAGATWTPDVSGLPGEAIRALEFLPGAVLASTRGSTLYRSTDGGATFAPAGSPEVVNDVLADGADLWIGSAGFGVLRSSDAGATMASAAAAAMNAPGLSDLAADGTGALYLSSSSSGVFRSTNGGASWGRASDGLGSLSVLRLAAAEPGRVWAAAWDGVHTTTDGGDSWSLAGFGGRRAFEVVPLAGGTVLAVVNDDLGRPCIQRSTDAGTSWTQVYVSDLDIRLEAAAVASDGSVLVAGMSFFGGTLVRSTDAGASWTGIVSGMAGVGALAAAPGGLVWAAAHDNVLHRSTDHGASWTALPAGGWPTGTVGSLASLAHRDGALHLVGTGQVYRSLDAGDSWEPFDDGLGEPAGVTFVAAAHGALFAGTYRSGLYRHSGSTGTPEVAAGAAPRFAAAPNPFRADTRLSWVLPSAADVRLRVHDVRGRLVADLSPGPRPAGAGAIAWDGTVAGRPVPPGTYFVRWEAGGRREVAKLVRVR